MTNAALPCLLSTHIFWSSRRAWSIVSYSSRSCSRSSPRATCLGAATSAPVADVVSMLSPPSTPGCSTLHSSAAQALWMALLRNGAPCLLHYRTACEISDSSTASLRLGSLRRLTHELPIAYAVGHVGRAVLVPQARLVGIPGPGNLELPLVAGMLEP